MRKPILCMLLIFSVLLLTTSCDLNFLPTAETGASLPDLSMLSHENWYSESTELQKADGKSSSDQSRKIDLWLCATQNAGGINPNEDSIYSHSGKKYCEGGFHYRYNDKVGWYETILRCALQAGSRSSVRLLRCGNERFTDDFLQSMGLIDSKSNAEKIRSIRRDLMTFAFNPKSDLLKQFSDFFMEDSFYSLGTTMICQMENLSQQQLENPSDQEKMIAAQKAMTERFSKGTASVLTDLSNLDNPLCYALENLNLSNLSVITFDPADLESLTGRNENDLPVDTVSRILETRGIFESNLCVGLYAFTLDYAGQIGKIGAANLTEPLIWGHLKYDAKEQSSDDILVMPRTMLVLLIGTAEQLEEFCTDWNSAMDSRSELKELRGPKNDELSYCSNGETVVQKPFAFSYHYTEIKRLSAFADSHSPQNAQLLSDCVEIISEEDKRVAVIKPDEYNQMPDASLAVAFPFETGIDELDISWSTLQNVEIQVTDSLLFDKTIDNLPGTVLPEGTQSIAYRNHLYLFSEDVQFENPFSFVSSCEESGQVKINLLAKGSMLRAGWYHVKITVAAQADEFKREQPEWISSLNVNVSEEEIEAWEKFSLTVSQNEQYGHTLSPQVSHAWGNSVSNLYHGVTVPECPQVWKAFELEHLYSQLMSSADKAVIPLLDYEFDVLVTAQNSWLISSR